MSYFHFMWNIVKQIHTVCRCFFEVEDVVPGGQKQQPLLGLPAFARSESE